MNTIDTKNFIQLGFIAAGIFLTIALYRNYKKEVRQNDNKEKAISRAKDARRQATLYLDSCLYFKEQGWQHLENRIGTERCLKKADSLIIMHDALLREFR